MCLHMYVGMLTYIYLLKVNRKISYFMFEFKELKLEALKLYN